MDHFVGLSWRLEGLNWQAIAAHGGENLPVRKGEYMGYRWQRRRRNRRLLCSCFAFSLLLFNHLICRHDSLTQSLSPGLEWESSKWITVHRRLFSLVPCEADTGNSPFCAARYFQFSPNVEREALHKIRKTGKDSWVEEG